MKNDGLPPHERRGDNKSASYVEDLEKLVGWFLQTKTATHAEAKACCSRERLSHVYLTTSYDEINDWPDDQDEFEDANYGEEVSRAWISRDKFDNESVRSMADIINEGTYMCNRCGTHYIHAEALLLPRNT